MGAYLDAPITTKDSSDGGNSQLKFGCSAMQGWRKEMEDAHIAIPNFDIDISLFGVFDGHGGRQVSAFAKKHFPVILKSSPSFKAKNYKQALIESFIEIDKLLGTPEGKKETVAIYLEDHKPTKKNKMFPAENDIPEVYGGCTACIVLLTKTEIYVANVGDSRCVISNKGTAVEMSVDHKPELETEKTRITKAGGYVDDNRVNGMLNLSRALGDLNLKDNPKLKLDEQLVIPIPDIRIEKITPDIKFIFVACDGVWECISSQDLVKFVSGKIGKESNSKIIEDLMDSIIGKKVIPKGMIGGDNMTALIITMNNA